MADIINAEGGVQQSFSFDIGSGVASRHLTCKATKDDPIELSLREQGMQHNPRGIGTLTAMLKVMLYAGIGFLLCTAGMWIAKLTDQPPLLPPSIQFGYDLIASLLTISTYIVFGRWIWVASRNLWDRGVAGLTFSPAASVGWFFVPLANLVMPYNAMCEIWNGSRGESGSALKKDNNILLAWWGCWVATFFLSGLFVRLAPDYLGLRLFTSASGVALYWLASRIVTTIGHAQVSGLESLQETFK